MIQLSFAFMRAMYGRAEIVTACVLLLSIGSLLYMCKTPMPGYADTKTSKSR